MFYLKYNTCTTNTLLILLLMVNSVHVYKNMCLQNIVTIKNLPVFTKDIDLSENISKKNA